MGGGADGSAVAGRGVRGLDGCRPPVGPGVRPALGCQHGPTGDDGGGGDASDRRGRHVGGGVLAHVGHQGQEPPGLGRPTRGEVPGGRCAEDRRCEDAGQAGVDLHELEVDPHAGAAPVEVVLDLAGVASGEAPADVAADVVADPGAGGVLVRPGVHGQEGLPQALPGPVGQGRDRVRAHAEQRRHLGRPLSLDLEVPEHELPPFGEGGEGPRGGGALELLDREVPEGDTRVQGREVPGGPGAGPHADLVHVQPTERRQQVGPEGDLGAPAALQDPEHLREGVRDQVVDVGTRDQLPGEAPCRVGVAGVQLAVGVEISAPYRRDQVGVRGTLGAGNGGHGGHRARVMSLTPRHPTPTSP